MSKSVLQRKLDNSCLASNNGCLLLTKAPPLLGGWCGCLGPSQGLETTFLYFITHSLVILIHHSLYFTVFPTFRGAVR